MWDISAFFLCIELIYGNVGPTRHQTSSYGTVGAQLLYCVCLHVGNEHMGSLAKHIRLLALYVVHERRSEGQKR